MWAGHALAQGTEDLGAALKANFNFEQYHLNPQRRHHHRPDAFGRQANVGFSGGFWHPQARPQLHRILDDINGAANSSGFDSAPSATSPVSTSYTGSSSAQTVYCATLRNGWPGAAPVGIQPARANRATNDITSTAPEIQAAAPSTVGAAYPSKTNQHWQANQSNTPWINGSYDLGTAQLGHLPQPTRENPFTVVGGKQCGRTASIKPQGHRIPSGRGLPCQQPTDPVAGPCQPETEASNGVKTAAILQICRL